MVVLLDLDEGVQDPHADPHFLHGHSSAFANLKHQLRAPLLRNNNASTHESAAVADERLNPNLNGFSAALSCYP
jgi:hypothetical protein